MEIVRIPSAYLSQIEYLGERDKAYIFDTLLKLCNGQDVKVEKSLVGGILISIYREALQMENKARAKKGKKSLEIDLATLMRDTESRQEVRPSNITSSQEKENKEIIVSKETKELAPIKKQIMEDINNLISEIKQVCNEYGLAYNKNRERQFAKHILTAKDYGEFAENVGLDRVRLAKNIIVLSQEWWKGPCTGPEGIYKNYASVFNKCKMKAQKKEKVILDIPEEDIF